MRRLINLQIDLTEAQFHAVNGAYERAKDCYLCRDPLTETSQKGFIAQLGTYKATYTQQQISGVVVCMACFKKVQGAMDSCRKPKDAESPI